MKTIMKDNTTLSENTSLCIAWHENEGYVVTDVTGSFITMYDIDDENEMPFAVNADACDYSFMLDPKY